MTQVAAIGCFLLGSLTLVNWWFEMFSDSFFGQVARETGKYLNGGKNSVSLVFPFHGTRLYHYLSIQARSGAWREPNDH